MFARCLFAILMAAAMTGCGKAPSAADYKAAFVPAGCTLVDEQSRMVITMAYYNCSTDLTSYTKLAQQKASEFRGVKAEVISRTSRNFVHVKRNGEGAQFITATNGQWTQESGDRPRDDRSKPGIALTFIREYAE